MCGEGEESILPEFFLRLGDIDKEYILPENWVAAAVAEAICPPVYDIATTN